MVGSDITPQIVGLARVPRGHTGGFAARLLSSDVLTGKNLLLTMPQRHLRNGRDLTPAHLRRTFIIRELAGLLPHVSLQVVVYEWSPSIFLNADCLKTSQDHSASWRRHRGSQPTRG